LLTENSKVTAVQRTVNLQTQAPWTTYIL